MTDTTLQIGDVVDMVVLHPNTKSERDPAAKYHGDTVWLHFPKDVCDPGDAYVGMPVCVRIADVKPGGAITAAVIETIHTGEDDDE